MDLEGVLEGGGGDERVDRNLHEIMWKCLVNREKSREHEMYLREYEFRRLRVLSAVVTLWSDEIFIEFTYHLMKAARFFFELNKLKIRRAGEIFTGSCFNLRKAWICKVFW